MRWLALLVLAACSAVPAPAPLTVVTYNVLTGLGDGRRAPATEWLRTLNADVVALQEMNGFTAGSLKAWAARWGHGHSVLLKENGYPVALTSRTPIEVVERRLEGMHHGFLHGRTAGIDFFVVHFSPSSYRVRRREVEIVIDRVATVHDEGRRVLVLGDLNTHSPRDRAFLTGQVDLLARRAGGQYLVDGAFDYQVLTRLEEVDFVDLVHRHQPRDPVARATFPTRILRHISNATSQRRLLERIDFVLADPELAARCTAAWIPRDPVLETISDHYPVVAVFR